ncbi:MAG: Rieske (2Fe-2S) protein [Longimicrobiales bacterium]
MPGFVRVAALDELPPGAMLAVEVDGKEICLVNTEGEIYAVRNNCTHRDFPLCEGTIHGGATIECAWHGARFDLKSGRAIRLPAIKAVKTYEVMVEAGEILVKL